MAKYGTFKYGEMPYGNLTLWVYDRTQSDIINDTDKAYVLYTDLNRIETRMQELSEKLNSYSYMQSIVTKTDWTSQTEDNFSVNIPSLSQLQRIRNNEQKLINALFVYSYTPSLPSTFENLNTQRMNDVEKILHDLYYMIKDMEENFRECDTFYCGEE